MVSKLTSAEILNFLIIISIILVSARLLGEVCRRFKQPAVVGEVIAGILIGPSLFGSVFPKLFNTIFISQPRAYGAFDGLANVGIILLMFSAGAEVDLKQIRRFGKQATYISLTGLIFPFAIGFATVWLFYDQIFSAPAAGHLIPALFVGTALSITALSVIAKVLIDINIIKTKVGNLVLTAAMIDDFLGWILFSVIITLMNKQSSGDAYSSVAYVLLFAALVMTVGRWLADKLLKFASEHLAIPGGSITVGVCLCFVAAVITEWLGVRGIFGAFLMGVAVGDSKYFQDRTQNILQQFAVNIAAPLFFASIGLRLNFVTNFNLQVVLVILLVASVAKIAGAIIGSRLSGMRKNESYAVAFGMNARGSQELVLGLLALQAKIINEQVFVGLVVMTLVSILIAGPLMRHFLNKDAATQTKPEKAVAETKTPANVALEV